MIKAQKRAAPQAFLKVSEKETLRAVAHHQNPVAGAKPFKFEAYKDESVKAALIACFSSKCAYCDGVYASTQPMDVEHWRPKGLVIEEDRVTKSSGYYWLAATWDNLLPSCIDCNRERKHVELPDGSTKSLGKGNRFPLADPSKRAKNPKEEAHEIPLLLHPYFDDASNDLEFDDNGVAFGKTEKGKVSISVYGLNRHWLVLERRQILRQMQQRMNVIEKLSDLLERRLPRQIHACIFDLLGRELEVLFRFRESDRPYCLMAQQKIAEFREKLESG